MSQVSSVKTGYIRIGQGRPCYVRLGQVVMLSC
jgi:hypothetical protein